MARTDNTEKYTTRQLLKWLWRASHGARAQIALCTLIGIVSVGCSLGFVYLSKETIDIATGAREGSLLNYGTGMALLMLTEIVLHAIDNWIVNIQGVKVQNRLRSGLYEQLMQSEWQGKEHHHSGDVLNRLVQDLNTIVATVTDTLPFAMVTLVQLGASFGFLFAMDRTLAMMLMLILPFFMLLSRIYVRRMRQLTKAVRESDSRIHAIIQEGLQHKTVVKTLEQTHEMGRKLNTMQEQLHDEVRRRARFSVLSRSMVGAGFSTGYLTAFLWGAFRIHGGGITFGVMTAFLQLAGRIQRPLSEMARLISSLAGTLTATERLIELEEQPREETTPPIKMIGTAGIRLDNVSFSYDNTKEVITRLDADFPPGSTTAILGETGAGKTTLAVSPRPRANLIYVPQGNTLFRGSLRDNLLLGRPDATDEELWEVLHTACADFVTRLPDGLDTLCSERGGGLSEGQAQRIAIARSLLRPGSVLLLDEATSALDADTERRFLQNMAATNHEKTIIFITHRTSVLEYCDRVMRIGD